MVYFIEYVSLIVLNVLDWVLTALIVGSDYSLEANPIMQTIMVHSGHFGAGIFKILTLISLGYILYKYAKTRSKSITIALVTLIMVYLVVVLQSSFVLV